jgi:hypothetical protein
MNFRFTVVETHLNRAEFRWKWLCFLERSLLLGILFCALTLLFGGAVLAGWVTSKPLGVLFFTVLGIGAFVAWVVIIVGVLVGDAQRPWLAAAVERVEPRLLDRLNTLVFLERHRADGRVESFARRIARQTQMLLAKKPAGRAFSATQSLKYSLAFVILLVATVFFYQGYSPWSRLIAAPPKQALAKKNASADKPLELAPPATNNVEQNQAWGEVRITDPGNDMQVTKVDVVPLQIEAAANQALKGVNWYSTINGKGESEHTLPPPSEPRYAVYQPTLYLDELNLSDWDVMTYYAKAKTEKDDAYASEVYFLEVRPFREDILKMPGGENGMAYQSLNDLSSLIKRQQHIIRQTHQHLQKPPEQESLRTQDRRKLAESEGDLSEATEHLYAQMSSRMENKPIGEALDNLAKAEQALDHASKLLQTNSMNQAQNEERDGLSALVAARKMFQKAVSDNPSAFGDSKEDEETSPTADTQKQLNEMAEFRNESKAAQEFVRRTLEQQRMLEQQARSSSRTDFSRLSGRENQLEKSLEFFQEQHPQPFQGTRKEVDQARQAMNQAADSLQKRNADARDQVGQASSQLEKLSDSLNNQMAMQQLGDAYKLKQMLDRQAQTFGQRAKPDSKISDAELQKNVDAARQTLDQLKKTAEQDPTRSAFGQPLRDALSDQNRAEMEAKLQQLQQAPDEPSKQQRAGQARDALGQVSKAFSESQPKSLQYAQQHDALSPNAQDSFNQGMAELDSLVKQMENSRQTPRDDLKKQGREAFYNLQRGIRSLHGENDQAKQLLMALQDQLNKEEGQIDVAVLKRLMNDLQHFSMEAADQLATKEDKPEVTNIDPARLPPAYRGRIQKYFQKLSEK